MPPSLPASMSSPLKQASQAVADSFRAGLSSVRASSRRRPSGDSIPDVKRATGTLDSPPGSSEQHALEAAGSKGTGQAEAPRASPAAAPPKPSLRERKKEFDEDLAMKEAMLRGKFKAAVVATRASARLGSGLGSAQPIPPPPSHPTSSNGKCSSSEKKKAKPSPPQQQHPQLVRDHTMNRLVPAEQETEEEKEEGRRKQGMAAIIMGFVVFAIEMGMEAMEMGILQYLAMIGYEAWVEPMHEYMPVCTRFVHAHDPCMCMLMTRACACSRPVHVHAHHLCMCMLTCRDPCMHAHDPCLCRAGDLVGHPVGLR